MAGRKKPFSVTNSPLPKEGNLPGPKSKSCGVFYRCPLHVPELYSLPPPEVPFPHQILTQYLDRLKDVILFLFNVHKHITLSKAFH